jgi:hypothetical protein
MAHRYQGRGFMRAAIIAPLSLATLLLGSLANAATPADVLKCTEVRDDAARLACYDRTVPSLRTLPPAAPVAQAPKPPAPPVPPEQRFGAERLDKADKPPAMAEDVETITATLKDAYERSPGRWVFTLDNGQIWQQVVTQTLYGVKPGRKVTVEKALLGSYNLRIEGIKALIKVARAK